MLKKCDSMQLMRAAFNVNNMKLGRGVMAFAEKYWAIAPEQFGSMSNHQSVPAALNKRHVMDSLQQHQQAGALCANDAKSCCCCIALNVAVLALRRLGMLPARIQSMFGMLQLASHHVSTAFGISKHNHGGPGKPPPQSVGQGNGAGPVIWAVIFGTVIIGSLRSLQFCVAGGLRSL
jgi:hypothetical protein